MRAIRLKQWQSEPGVCGDPDSRPGPRRECAEGRRRGPLPQRPAPDGVATGGHAPTRCRSRSDTRRPARSRARPRAAGVARATASWYTALGLRPCWPCVQGMENRCQRPPASSAAWRWCRARRWPGRLHARPVGALPDRDRRPRRRCAAPLSDAALTPYHAIKTCGDQLRPGATLSSSGLAASATWHAAVAALSSVRIVAWTYVRTRSRSPGRGSRDVRSAVRPRPQQLRAEARQTRSRSSCSTASPQTRRWSWQRHRLIGGEICYLGRAGGITRR